MKTCLEKQMLLLTLTLGLAFILAGRLRAETLTVLHSFTAVELGSLGNGDGAKPVAGLVLAGNTLYGTAQFGGSGNFGTVFAVNTDGSGFANQFSFNSNAAFPQAGLVLSGNTLYGTTEGNGSSDFGTVFAMNLDGSSFTNLHTFGGGNDGAYPFAGLVVSGDSLYGATAYGGSPFRGTVFKLNTNGTAFTILHTFTANPDVTNEDGDRPLGRLVLAGDMLYGTTEVGGTSGSGAVFAVRTDGTGFTNLHNFTGPSDAGNPYAGLVLAGNTLYGTTQFGGGGELGTVFAVNTDGSSFANLHTFTGGADGAIPSAALLLSGHRLYGTTSSGTVFALNTDGTGFTTLYSFTPVTAAGTNADGASPYADLILSGNTLYGTTSAGGSGGNGTIFSLSLAAQLTITFSGSNVILTWPVEAAGFTLQCNANPALSLPWSPVSAPPVIVNGRYTVTNPISGNQQFYRLSQ